MGVLIHPQSELIREPRLLVPKQQPLGPVRVDKSHPLAPDQCHLTSKRYDLGRFVADTTTAPMTPAIGGAGIGPKTNGSSTEYRATTPAISGDPGTAWTVLTHFVPHAYGGTYSAIWDAGGNFRLLCNTSGTITYLHGSAFSPSGLANMAINAAHVVLVRRTSGSIHTIGVNGVLSASTSAQQIGCPAGYFSFGLQPSTGGSNTSATYLLHAVWLRWLDDGESISAMRDPYQFLIPV